MTDPGTAAVIWYFTDRKPGHESQIHGLLQALARCISVEAYEIRAQNVRWPAFSWLSGTAPWARQLPDPRLIIGAGHATHVPMLAARRARGGKIIVLMKPSLSPGLFDLVVVPAHDRVKPAPNIFVSQGVLNPILPSADKDPGSGLILLGGPSAHHGWDSDVVLPQLSTIIARDTAIYWLVTTSRRTPQGFTRQLEALSGSHVRIIPFEQTKPGWIGQRLAKAERVWVSEDSVSMVYEALTAGASCGLLQLPRRGKSRVSRGIDRLLRQGIVTAFRDWEASGRMKASGIRFNEADRCAAQIVKRWLCTSD